MAPENVAAILLAAGESSRMGQPKPLLPWLGTTLVAYQVEQLLLAGVAPLVVVLGHEAGRVAAALSGFHGLLLVPNPAYTQGKTTSIRVGVEAIPKRPAAILLHAVDQPRRADTLRLLIASHLAGRQLITVPSYRGRRGHPPLFSASLEAELSGLSEQHQGLREVMRRHHDSVVEVAVDSPEVLLNLNSAEDYRQALAFFQAASP